MTTIPGKLWMIGEMQHCLETIDRVFQKYTTHWDKFGSAAVNLVLMVALADNAASQVIFPTEVNFKHKLREFAQRCQQVDDALTNQVMQFLSHGTTTTSSGRRSRIPSWQTQGTRFDWSRYTRDYTVQLIGHITAGEPIMVTQVTQQWLEEVPPVRISARYTASGAVQQQQQQQICFATRAVLVGSLWGNIKLPPSVEWCELRDQMECWLKHLLRNRETRNRDLAAEIACALLILEINGYLIDSRLINAELRLVRKTPRIPQPEYHTSFLVLLLLILFHRRSPLLMFAKATRSKAWRLPLRAYASRLTQIVAEFQVTNMVAQVTPGTEVNCSVLEQVMRPNEPKLQRALEGLGRLNPVRLQLKKLLHTQFGFRHVQLLDEYTYVRVKNSRTASTKAHADFYFLVKETDLLRKLGPAATDYSTTCVICQTNAGKQFEHVRLCGRCARKPVPLYTAWIPLGTYDRLTHSLLVFDSTQYAYSNSTTAFRRELPVPPKQLKFKQSTGRPHQQLGDVTVFNCKTVHQATAGHNLRLSLDFRFFGW